MGTALIKRYFGKADRIHLSVDELLGQSDFWSIVFKGSDEPRQYADGSADGSFAWRFMGAGGERAAGLECDFCWV